MLWQNNGDRIIMKNEEMITITKKEWDYLIKRDAFLERLEMAGVDNWEGYSCGFDDEDEETEEDIYG